MDLKPILYLYFTILKLDKNFSISPKKNLYRQDLIISKIMGLFFTILGGIIGGIVYKVPGIFIGGFLGMMIDLLLTPEDNKRRYLTFDEKVAAMRRAENRCEQCGSIKDLSIHHIKPLSRGGTNHIDNLTVLCRRCNSRKGNRSH